jgi:hypothetical protein
MLKRTHKNDGHIFIRPLNEVIVDAYLFETFLYRSCPKFDSTSMPRSSSSVIVDVPGVVLGETSLSEHGGILSRRMRLDYRDMSPPAHPASVDTKY